MGLVTLCEGGLLTTPLCEMLTPCLALLPDSCNQEGNWLSFRCSPGWQICNFCLFVTQRTLKHASI